MLFRSDSAFIVVDAFDRGSYIKVVPEENKIIGYTTRNSGGVPQNFKNYFIIQFDTPFILENVWNEYKPVAGKSELKDKHVGSVVRFLTPNGKYVQAKVASSFISPEQAELNLEEIGNNNFEQVKNAAKNRWNDVLGRIEVESENTDQLRTFYSCLYRSVLFPRNFTEIDAKGKVMHYSPYNGEVLPGYMFTDTG